MEDLGMNWEDLVHREIAEGVIVLACVYCLRTLLCGGGLKFKVFMCVSVCMCMCGQANYILHSQG